MFDILTINSDEMNIGLTVCLNIYKRFLKQNSFNVTQLGNKQLICVNPDNQERMIINMESITDTRTKVAIQKLP